MSDGPLGFAEWLLRLTDEQSPIGDLARDVQRDIQDDGWPEPEDGVESFEFYYDYLWSVDACQGALDALEDAWKRYEQPWE
ncbi:YozE family protein [Kitasatospora sp. NPDC048298]|uniref:YozE family protein n=1 Tax=Kitasatospora sp. NPDC048298 TaxID=3364049 RepID=UPI0037188703